MSYQLQPDGRFVIRNYNDRKPFSSFLPGIAGLFGMPAWVFYVSRGQGVASFGTRNKDNAILEFYPANKAYQMTPRLGFRTFIRETTNQGVKIYEPFQSRAQARARQSQHMEILSHELALQDLDSQAGWQTTVTYFTVPGEPLAALARIVEIKNITAKSRSVEILDGLAQVNPYGMNEFFVKNMSRTIEAWMMTENMDQKAPYLRLRVDATDRPEVETIEEGNFFFGYAQKRGKTALMEPLVDPSKVFGQRLDFASPDFFASGLKPDDFKLQVTENKTPCAFSHARHVFSPGESLVLKFCYGQARNLKVLNAFVERAGKKDYFSQKRLENEKLTEEIKSRIFTVSDNRAYDLYCGQTYLDNVMRGGLPVCLGEGEDPFIFYVYSRKHGDLERDYNRFLVEPSYLAQGDGNYRDVNQNRRCDPWFEPRVRDLNVRTFLNLIQLDGYNPLVVKGAEFHFNRSAAAKKKLVSFFGAGPAKVVLKYMAKPFKLGEFFYYLELEKLCPQKDFPGLLSLLSPFLSMDQNADHGEGYWVDHWTYNLDLIENYLAIYPEQASSFLFRRKDYTFFDNDHFVRPRNFKYVIHRGTLVRQYQSVYKDKEKSALLASRARLVNVVRTRHGQGEIYQTTLLVKLLCLFANKISSLDAHGIGVEMEADKPSWYDALNGLPGLLGSSLCETLELKRLCLFLIESLDGCGQPLQSTVAMPEEVHRFLTQLSALLENHFRRKNVRKNFDFWDQATTYREEYRGSVKMGVSGREKNISLAEIRLFLERSREKLELGIEEAFDSKTGLYPTYFENRVERFSVLRTENGLRAKPLSFSQSRLPAFLEGPVHALKTEKDLSRRRALALAVRGSGLYDRKLGMYKVNSPMQSASLEVGRARVFKPGWLENESIWLHMEYKWLLELLRGGLYDEFFGDFFKALVPFQPAERYGRSVLENSSFIVSSAFSDPTLHGAGFVARLSGSTAEFLQMWLLMNIGKKPFFVDSRGKLGLRLDPALPKSFFTKEPSKHEVAFLDGIRRKVVIPANAYAWTFLGKTLVVYHNPKRMDTFGSAGARPKKILLIAGNQKVAEFAADVVGDPWALAVREGKIDRIEVELV